MKLQEYVVKWAVNAGIEGRGALALASGINRSSLSKWYTGEEQPSAASLRKLARAIGAPVSDLLVLAGHVPTAELDGKPPVTPRPRPTVHPLAKELTAMLADDSPIPEGERETLTTVVDSVMDKYRRQMRARRKSA